MTEKRSFDGRLLSDGVCRYDCILFDFDGTLSESAPGVRYSLEKALEKMGRPVPDLSDYSKYLGPPLVNTLKNICGLTDEECITGTELYKSIYAETGIYKNTLYDGIEDVLRELNAQGVKLAVCSSKFEDFVRKACDYLKISCYFQAICGSSKDNSRKEKAELIPYALGKLDLKCGFRAALVGDTHYDAIGAAKLKIDFIGAEYGYGLKELMEKHGGKIFVKTPREILDVVQNGG